MSDSPSFSSPSRDRDVVRFETGHWAPAARDALTVEEPLEIRVNGASIAVVMRTPGDDRALAMGFLLTEAIVSSPGQIAAIELLEGAAHAGNVAGVILAPGVPFDPDRLKRNFYASSSCGLCGKASIESVRLAAPPLRGDWKVSPQIVLSLPEKLRAAQPVFDQTGSLHAAGIFDIEGRLLWSAEDVGRHNAVDKAIGRAALEGSVPLDSAILAVSGRISFEIAQKALMAGVPMIAAVSGASTLAAELAEESGMTLAGFVRGGAMTVYSGAARIHNS